MCQINNEAGKFSPSDDFKVLINSKKYFRFAFRSDSLLEEIR